MAKAAGSLFEAFPYRLILASSSPRRQELLEHLGIPFSIQVPAVEELRREGELPTDYVQRNALEKAQAIVHTLSNEVGAIIIGADTIGVLEGKVLEKPLDTADAERMLGSMSGLTHEILTGVAAILVQGSQTIMEQITVTTQVQFKTLSPREIAYYVSTGEPMDKAGAYGIQGIGGLWVERLQGSYSNVVGLPLAELVQLLQRLLAKAQ